MKGGEDEQQQEKDGSKRNGRREGGVGEGEGGGWE